VYQIVTEQFQIHVRDGCAQAVPVWWSDARISTRKLAVMVLVALVMLVMLVLVIVMLVVNVSLCR
jgi:hypothetical protein